MCKYNGIDISKAALITAICALLLLPALPAYSAEVLILGNSELKPVADVIEGIKETVKVEISIMSPKDARYDLGRIVREENASAVIALGKDAVISSTSLPESIPVVYGLVVDPIKTERKNMTGVYMSTPVTEYISFIKKNFPAIQKVGIICHENEKEHLHDKALMSMVKFHQAKTPYEFVETLHKLSTEVDAVILLPERELITSTALQELYLFSFREKVPVIGISEKYVKIGSLFSLGFDTPEMGRQIGELTNRVIAEGSAAGILHSSPDKLNLYINTMTSETMRVKIPDGLLKTAKKVYP